MTSLGGRIILQQLDGMRQHGRDDCQVFQRSLGAAGQVDDQRSPADARRGSGEHGMRGDLQAGSAHGLCQTGRGALDDRRVASGVTSRGLKPVPPVVRMISTSPESAHSTSSVAQLQPDHPAGSACWTTCQPCAVTAWARAGPEGSGVRRAQERSETVRMAIRIRHPGPFRKICKSILSQPDAS